jgi:diaminopimelate decarboxylase/aspartate kinase
MSTRVGVVVLQQKGVDAIWVDAREMLCSDVEEAQNENDKYLDGDVHPSRNLEAVDKASAGHKVVVTQGFIARTSSSDKATCLLGRGGSDTSAALFAALADAARLEIWTDVHGLFTSDPRQVPTARLLKQLSYREAFTMAAMGAKVLHQRCLRPAEWATVPLEIRNTLDPEGPYTCICKEETKSEAEELQADALDLNNSSPRGSRKPEVVRTRSYSVGHSEDGEDLAIGPVVLGIASCKSTLVTVSTRGDWGATGYLAKVLGPFTQLSMSVDLIACSQYAVSITLDHVPGGVDGDAFQLLCKRLEALGELKVGAAVALLRWLSTADAPSRRCAILWAWCRSWGGG